MDGKEEGGVNRSRFEEGATSRVRATDKEMHRMKYRTSLVIALCQVLELQS